MAQIKVEKDRSYRLGKGAALEATNDRLSEEFHEDLPPAAHMRQLHATKGFRDTSRQRLENHNTLEAAMHGWAKLAAKITGSVIGGTHPEPRKRTWDKPHHGERECARRRRQMDIA